MKLIIAILIGAGLFFAIRLTYRKFWEEGLSVAIDFPDRMVREGEESRLLEVITNNKWLPLPILQIKFAITRTFRFAKDGGSDVTDQYYRNEYFALRSFERVSRTYPFTCTKRGLFSMRNMDLICKDLFMSEEMYDSVEHSATLLVLPRRIREQEIPTACLRLLGEVVSRVKLQEDPFAFSTIREYQPYDGMGAVNWKVSARMNELMVNTFRTTLQRDVVIVLDLETHTKQMQERVQEALIRVAATLGACLCAEKIPTAFLTNGCDIITKEPAHVLSGAVKLHALTIETALARIDLKLPMPDITGILSDRMRENEHEEIVLISNNRRDDFTDRIRMIRENHGRLNLITAFLKQEAAEDTADFAYPWEIIDE
ncbi:MAG: DUF58 domain-containing protein [Lachnospiraceae bacterium]|nr:DUF58 domain-containing protein [Lachnospiraceae bacterium]